MEGGSTSGGGAALERLLEWLADVGPRWGVPAAACRVHGWLYLTGRSARADEIAGAVDLPPAEVEDALRWLAERRLAEETAAGAWRTGQDPWEMVSRALEVRREQELGPALAVLRTSRRDASGDPLLAGRIDRLLGLVDDIAAIDAQARRLSPATLRRLIGTGGRLARFLDRGRAAR